MQCTVRDHGAVPATVAVLGGALHIGLDDDQLEQLAGHAHAAKASAATLAHAMATGHDAGTTVSATLLACRQPETGPPIRVLATGGIGGVHRDWSSRPDVSADLLEIANTAACVVCTGAKSIHDPQATLEALEALGVAVVGFRTDRFPSFYAAAGDLRVPRRADDVAVVARWCGIQWHELGSNAGVLLANPVAPGAALEAEALKAALAGASEAAIARRVAGEDLTPFLLAEVARRMGPEALDANIALLANNARLAAQVAVAMAEEPVH
jgi:pseudouridine-5'-phosphate glycosidase